MLKVTVLSIFCIGIVLLLGFIFRFLSHPEEFADDSREREQGIDICTILIPVLFTSLFFFISALKEAIISL